MNLSQNSLYIYQKTRIGLYGFVFLCYSEESSYE